MAKLPPDLKPDRPKAVAQQEWVLGCAVSKAMIKELSDGSATVSVKTDLPTVEVATDYLVGMGYRKISRQVLDK